MKILWKDQLNLTRAKLQARIAAGLVTQQTVFILNNAVGDTLKLILKVTTDSLSSGQFRAADITDPKNVRQGTYDITPDTFVEDSAGTGVDNFLDLTDTPDDYTGQAGKVVVVNAAGDGLTFTEPCCESNRMLFENGDVMLYETGDVMVYESEEAPSGGGTWGTITGTLSDQTDLQTALDDLADDITAVEVDVLAIQGDITAIESDVLVLQSDVGDLQSDVADLQAVNSGFITFSISTGFNPADSTSYGFGAFPGLAPFAYGSALSRGFYVPVACSIKAVTIYTTTNGVNGSGESVTWQIDKNNGTTTNIGTGTLNGGTTPALVQNQALNIPLNGTTDSFHIKMVCPAFATNPTTVFVQGIIYFR